MAFQRPSLRLAPGPRRQGPPVHALGENNQRSTSQDLDKLQGKIVRLYPDGGVPKDNPSSAVPTRGRDLELWPPQKAGRRAGNL
ncbi:PQQ-dependent sugar dehydrogenase [Pseudomonas aeruginosa]|nr:PQQ-dependent sugar dehydrogenase [Pseudomonas aeruginosa]